MNRVFTLKTDLTGQEYEALKAELRKTTAEIIAAIVKEQLTPNQYEMYNDYYVYGKTMSQIAKERGVNETTVWRTVKRAYKTLQKFAQYLIILR